MLTARVRIQLIVFAILTVVVLSISAFQYIGLPKVLGFDRFDIKANFADASGLYDRANVTYRGIDVGQVTGLELRPDGVTVTMQIDKSAKIPSDAEAQIHSSSAIGEQYIDLVAKKGTGPYLASGQTIPRADTAGMPQIDPLLDDVDALVKSVPGDKLEQSLQDVQVAFGGAGGDLQRLLDNSTQLLDTAKANLGPTTALISTMEPFLKTQESLASDNVTSIKNLATLSDALVHSDKDLRGLIAKGPAGADAVTGLTNAISPTLPLLLDNLTQVGQTLTVYLAGTRQTLALAPAALAAFQRSYLNNDGMAGYGAFNFRLSVLDPPPCTQGYLPASSYRDPSDMKSISTPANLYCKPAGGTNDQRSVRGSRNFPCLDPKAVVARAASVQECLGEPAPGPVDLVPDTPDTSTAYDPQSGSFRTPDGGLAILGGDSSGRGLGAQTLLQLLVPISKSGK